MKWALANGQRTEPFPGGKATCPIHGETVIAKCGSHRVHYWSHLGGNKCDSWKENETEWHRTWKDNFNRDFQEKIQYDDQSGEKHIADVCTNHGLVIEFQHSHINPQERDAREHFYKNMVWVVDGTRLKRDYPRFSKWNSALRPIIMKNLFLIAHPEKCFPATWLGSSVPVYFDFLDVAPADSQDMIRNFLWCLLPRSAMGHALVTAVKRTDFAALASKGPYIFGAPVHVFVSEIEQHLRNETERALRATRIDPLQLVQQQLVQQRLARMSQRRRFSRF